MHYSLCAKIIFYCDKQQIIGQEYCKSFLNKLKWLSSKKVWALTIYDTKHSCFRLLGVICRLFSHWKYIFDVLCRAKNQTPGTREKSVARFFVHVAQRRTLSRTSLAVFIFLTFAGCCGTSSVSCLAAPNSRANIPRTLSCKCSDKRCDFNGAGFFFRITIAGDSRRRKRK